MLVEEVEKGLQARVKEVVRAKGEEEVGNGRQGCRPEAVQGPQIFELKWSQGQTLCS